MIDQIKKHIEEAKVFSPKTPAELEAFRIQYLGKKGILNDLFVAFKSVPNEEKKDFGQILNELKTIVNDKVTSYKAAFENTNTTQSETDLTRPGEPFELGSRHPINSVKNRIVEIFSRIGFTLSDGPEIEDDWHNFTALNLPEYHPARDMQDTFFIEQSPDVVLRTHTSSVQIRYMENNEPPIRILSPGRVYRNEAISARSHMMFHQIEGLYIDKDVSFADLRQTLSYFTEALFGKSKIRLRPSYFPFT